MSGNGASRCAPPERATRIRSSGESHSQSDYTGRPSDLQAAALCLSDKQRTVICVHHKKIIDLVLYVTHLKVKA